MKALIFIFMFFPVLCSAAEVDYLMIKLMQPKEVIKQKISGINGMSSYIKKVEVDINKRLAGVDALPSWGFLVIAVRDDGKVKAWLDSDAAISLPVKKAMVRVAEGTKSFAVKSGAVVFALGFSISGVELPPNTFPFPSEWKKVANCRNEDCDGQNIEALALKSW
jgi:hypothetical protein